MPSRLLYTIITGFLVGVYIGTQIPVLSEFSLWYMSIGVLILVCGTVGNWYKQLFLLGGILLFALALGIIRYEQVSLSHTRILDVQEEGEIVLHGVIVDEVERRENNQRFVLLDELSKARILVTTELYPVFTYGDQVVVRGTVEEPNNFLTDQGREFDYIHYLAKDDIFYTMSFAEVDRVGHDPISRLQEILFTLKSFFIKNIEAVVPRPESTFLSGITLGARAGISQELRNDFITTGTIHIVALSGYNISIVAKYIQDFFGMFLSFGASLYAGAVAIVVFVLMTGAQATAVRAGIMAVLVLVAKRTGHTYAVGRALAIAATLMVIHNPRILVHDVSFQLSCLATIGIIYGTPIVERWLGKRHEETRLRTISSRIMVGLRDIVATTFAAQLVVLPYIVYTMGTLSIISFPLNIVILPFIPFAMALGFIIAMTGFLGTWFTLPFGFVVTVVLSYILDSIVWAAEIPNAMLSVPPIPFVYISIVYCLYGYLYYLHTKKHEN